MSQKSVVWNLTRQCVWNCMFCCQGTSYVPHLKQINTANNRDFRCDGELNFYEKKKIIDQLAEIDCKVDMAGGELFVDPLHFELVKYASEKIGKENIGISTSGAFLTKELIKELSQYINDIELSLDCAPFTPFDYRPVGYHEYSANALVELRKNKVFSGVQTVLYKANMQHHIMDELFEWIASHDINKWSLLRLMPSGRGSKFEHLMPTDAEYIEIINYIKSITDNCDVQVDFQYLLPNGNKSTLQCRAVKKSIGILPDGTVTACFWALDNKTLPNADKFNLGQVPFERLSDILQNDKAKYWCGCEHQCCVI